MCRGKKICTELTHDPKKWSQHSPLQPPNWFREQVDIFAKAVEMASVAEIEKSIKLLHSIRSNDLRDWYCEHGQMSGWFRNEKLGTKTSKVENIKLDPLRSPDPYRKEIFDRDSYTCQYCGIKVIPKEIFAAYSKIVGLDLFRPTGTNQERHGIVLAFRANVDHVDPWVHGGKTKPSNLVTSCWSCNYGKSGYTLEEIVLADPREQKRTTPEWAGLAEYLPALKSHKQF